MYSPQEAFLKLKRNRLARQSLKRLGTIAGMAEYKGGQKHDPNKPMVVVVSHQASKTGAPILALNLCMQLSTSHNVIVVLLSGGALFSRFLETGTALLMARYTFVNHKVVRGALKRASLGRPIEFALANCIVSAPFIEPIRSLGIPCLCLVHEYASYVKPLTIFTDVGLWASRLIWPTRLTMNDMLRRCPHLVELPMEVMPQGPCVLPEADQDGGSANTAPLATETVAERYLRHLDKDTLLVLGAGTIEMRKGVDLFIETASRISKNAQGMKVKYAWIGSGYLPDYDFNVSVWLNDQINRSGLGLQLTMLDESPAYRELIKRCDLFIMSSRLDALPNVAIDAMLAGKPVLCFENACGIAEQLEPYPDLHGSCVAPYLDCTDLAQKALDLLQDPGRRNQIAELTLAAAENRFQMDGYVARLRELGKICREESREEDSDISYILDHRLIDRKFHTTNTSLSDRTIAQRYVLSWRKNIYGRKPFAGFHPGIYFENNLSSGSGRDPLVDWHQQGQPSGLWQVQVIESSPVLANLNELSVALHVHVFSPEFLTPILARLNFNSVRPDLYISFSDPDFEPEILRVSAQFDLDPNLRLVPNLGRDMGPLLSELALELDRCYSLHGHVHTIFNEGVHVPAMREFLQINLLGNTKLPMLDRILSQFVQQPGLGMVFADDPNCLGWSENRDQAEALAQRLGLPPLPVAIDFPVGSMFWARKGSLKSLYELGLNWDDYPEEPLPYDGTILHAVERLMPQVCMANGYTYAVAHVPGISR
ncbi:MAG: glycosyltransferase [Cyanobacteria bacterium]|nr:glycosyltransferase [Cyanobacteriota bacterium]